MEIQVATTSEETTACFAVMSELRPHLSLTGFIALVERMQNNHGYSLVYLNENGVKPWREFVSRMALHR